MSGQLCFQCFRVKGDYDVCPWCGYTTGDTENQAYQLTPGTILNDRYIIGTTLGIGGFGITYKAYDTVLSIVVAIKEFYPARLVNRGAGETKVGIFSGEKREEYNHLLKRFQEEAQIMAKFSKEPDIVNIYDYIEANETAYIVMEYIDGVLLKDRLEQVGKMTVEEAVGYMTAILNAMAKVHYQGIVHKDISPDNIFITGEGTVKLTDFGAARLQGTKSSEKTEAIVKVGYTPPEQYQGGSEQGTFMDIYAAGAVFYQMLTGKKPQDAMDRQMEDTMESPAQCGIELDSRLDKIVMKAMAVNPKFRFQTAEQFRNAIVSRKNVDLPEEELRKRKWITRITGAVAVLTMAVTLTVLLLSQTIFSSRGKIDVAGIKKDTVEVWIPVKEEESAQSIQQLTKALTEEMEKKCSQITLKIETIPLQDYEGRLQNAVKKDALPEVFCTDYLSEEWKIQDYCAELTSLMNTLDTADYLFLEELQKEKNYELPTAVQTGVVYINKGKADISVIPESYTKEKVEEEYEFMCPQLAYADEKYAFEDFDTEENWDVYQLAGDLSVLDEVKAVTIDRIPPTDFTVIPVLEGNQIVGCFQNCYGVRKTADKNQGKAAMLVLAVLLSDRLQSISYMDNEQGIPINRAVYEDYKEYKMTTYLAFLKEYGEDRIAIQEDKNIYEYLRGE